jgi:3-hydroxymyristoyl/3-hydroxydecanoyl-(acyl carrier protein) dehydratase
MYESCLHALRIFLMRAGWIGSRARVAFEPVPGIANRLKCRGQIVESSRVVTYEIMIKERGFRPEPYAIADALILADGKPIVAVTDMALQLSGTSRAELEQLWKNGVTGERTLPSNGAMVTEPPRDSATSPVLFDRERILAFAIGKPSDAFGAAYRVFDEGRFVARLPGPPYQFLDRITRIDAEPLVMAAGGSAEAQFDIAADAWYFEADRQDRMPFAVLLEAALQACGWMAAFMGSALKSDGDLKFRNLGGTARQHLPVTRRTGTLTSKVRVAKISSTAGMILQHYEFAVFCRDALVYDGSAEFGFFHPDALIQQVGIKGARPYELTADEKRRAESFPFPEGAPYPDSRWRMIDQVDALVVDGGRHGLGFVQGSTRVDAAAWFFKAHFLGDPVWPGSLGLESFLQLLKVMVVAKFGAGAQGVFESPALQQLHHWTYRGQIIPTNQVVTVQAEIKSWDESRRLAVADGILGVDGKVIYQMNDFSILIS